MSRSNCPGVFILPASKTVKLGLYLLLIVENSIKIQDLLELLPAGLFSYINAIPRRVNSTLERGNHYETAYQLQSRCRIPEQTF